MARPARTRPFALIAAIAAIGVAASTSLSAEANTYGKLLARHQAAPATSLETSFTSTTPPESFLLVVTQPARTALEVRWSVHCAGASHHERGGASGRALTSSGHWVKRVRADWIKHPASCAGSISGSAASSPVLVRVFAR